MAPEELAKLIANRDSLDLLLFWLGWGLICFTALVVIGLYVEYQEPIRLAWREHRWRALLFWRMSHIVVGGLLITGGVAGELLIEFFASRVETKVRAIGGRIETHFNERASQADERSKKLEHENLQLRKELANRLFESDPHDRFQVLKGSPKASAEVWYMKYDGRAYVFATGVVQSLRALGWSASEPLPVERTPNADIPFLRGSAPIIGTSLFTKTPMPLDEIFAGAKAHTTGGSLRWAVGAGSGGVDPHLPENTFRIIVGQRSPTLP